MKKQCESFVKKLLNSLDLKLVRASNHRPVDLTNSEISGRASQYYVGIKPAIVNVDLADGRSNRWFELSSESLDPPIFAIRKSLDARLSGKNLSESIFNILDHHRRISPCKNAAEKLGLKGDTIFLKEYPSWAAVNPWDSKSIEKKFVEFPVAVKKNRKANGLLIDTDNPEEIMRINDELSLESHAIQYSKITESIKKNGFKYGDAYGYVTAEILVKNNQFRWKPGGDGNHRVAAAAALGFKKIPVLVTKVIYVDDFKIWPNVSAGNFASETALKIFNNVFNAIPPGYQESWVNYVRNSKAKT